MCPIKQQAQNHTHKTQPYTHIYACLHHTVRLSEPWWERTWHWLLHQACCTAVAHTDREHFISFLYLWLLCAFIVSPWAWHLSLSAVKFVCSGSPARKKICEDMSSSLVARHRLFKKEHKQIDWAAILQLLMLTHSVHYRRGSDTGRLEKTLDAHEVVSCFPHSLSLPPTFWRLSSWRWKDSGVGRGGSGKVTVHLKQLLNSREHMRALQ